MSIYVCDGEVQVQVEVKMGMDAIARGEVVDGPTAMEALRQRNHQRYSGS